MITPLRIVLLMVLLLIIGCSSENSADQANTAEEQDENIYGSSFTPAFYMTVNELIPVISEEEQGPVQVKGEIVQVCQSKGCWLTLVADDERQVRVTFKDYEFFVPTDAAGKEVVMEGITWYEKVSVDRLRHYAEDAGDSAEKINAITEPEYSYYFEATGVLFL